MKMISKIRTLFLLLALVLCIGASAQMASFSVKAPGQVVEGNNFTVTFRVVNGNTQITKAQAPQLSGCTLLYGPGVSTMESHSYSGGKMESTIVREYSFAYRADKAGTTTVPTLTINEGGKHLSSKRVNITILPPDKSARRSSSPAYEDTPAAGGQPNAPSISAKDIIVTVTMSKNHVYENEAVIATIRVYTKHDITSFRATTLPSFDGFLSEELQVKEQPHLTNFRGDNYYTVIVKQCLLYPQKSGKLTINSGRYDVTLQAYEYVSNGFFATARPVQKNITTESNSVTVNVSALPEPRPAGFNGAVGSNFAVKTSLEPNLLRTNEAATYTYEITGTGNIKYLSVPEIDFGTNIEEYNPESESDATFNGSDLTGKFTATYTIVPQHEGALDIPASKFVYFNPSSGKYVTVDVPATSAKIIKGSDAPATNVAAATKQATMDDILYIRPLGGEELYAEHHRVFHSLLYMLCYIIVVVALIVAIVAYRRYVRLNADVAGRRTARASNVAGKRLRVARSCMNHHQNDEFYAAVAAAIWGYLGDRLRIPASALTRDNISERLTEAGVDEQLIKRTIDLLDECEMARFTPSHSDSEVASLYDNAADVIRSLESVKKIKK